MPNNIALITSTIAPAPNTYLLQRSNPLERLSDYKNAFRFYADCLRAGTFSSIVYVDNSGWPLDELRDIASMQGVADRVEFISYISAIESMYSRYFLEIHLLKEAMHRSLLLATNCEDAIWKLTGRYLIRNVDTLVQSQPSDFDLYINLRNHAERALDFYFAGFKARTFDAILGADLEDYRCKQHGELILRNKIEQGRFAGYRVVQRFRRTPRILGVRGFDGASYHGTKDSVKFMIRTACNRIVPWLWI